MTELEFRAELKRHLIGIIRACMLYYGWRWADLLPRELKAEQSKQPLVIT